MSDGAKWSVAAALAATVVAITTVANGWQLWDAAPLGLAAAALALALLVRRGSRAPRRLLIVGSGNVADALCAAVAREGRAEVVGRLDERSGARVLSGRGDFEQLVARRRVDGVLFAHAGGDDSELAEAAERCRHLGLQVGEVPRLFVQLDQRVRGGHRGGVPLLLMDGRGHSGAAAVVTRALDCILAALVLVLTAPLWLAIAVAIVVDERGPVLYRARRVGQGGREFDMYKFRKMRSDAAGPRLTVSGDARFTRVGRFLARTKLDELPQLLNVLRGEMALVGPRPEDPSFVAEFPGAFDAITQVRPGITGLSQIQYRDESALLVGDDFEALYRELLLPQKIALDLFYARHRSLALDLRVLAWTVVAIVTGATVRRDDLMCSVSFARADGATLHEALRVDASAQPDALRDVA